MISRQNEIYSILGISWGEQSSPASPAVRTRQEEIFDILSFPAVSRHSSPNDVGAALEKGAPLGGAGTRSVTEGGTSAISASAQPPTASLRSAPPPPGGGFRATKAEAKWPPRVAACKRAPPPGRQSQWATAAEVFPGAEAAGTAEPIKSNRILTMQKAGSKR